MGGTEYIHVFFFILLSPDCGEGRRCHRKFRTRRTRAVGPKHSTLHLEASCTEHSNAAFRRETNHIGRAWLAACRMLSGQKPGPAHTQFPSKRPSGRRALEVGRWKARPCRLEEMVSVKAGQSQINEGGYCRDIRLHLLYE